MDRKVKVLIGIDEPYTRSKLVNCFRFRNDYEVDELVGPETPMERSKQLADPGYDLLWLEYEDIDFERLLTNKNDSLTLINSYCIRKGLIRKAQLAFYLKKYLTKKVSSDSHLARYIPETYVFQLDYLDYMDEALNEVFEVEQALRQNESDQVTKKFILKSSMTNKGAEMLLFDSRQQLERYFEQRVAMSEDETLDLCEWVIQAYLERPLLLANYKNRKFHLRVYVVAVGNLKVYVYRDILTLFSYSTYENVDRLAAETAPDLKAHITNTCFQLDACSGDESKRRDVENECVHRFWSLNFVDGGENETENQARKETIYQQIKQCVGELFECLTYEPTVFQPIANGFELYGFDFLVDDNYNVLFLEANAFPDFKQTGDQLNDLIDCLFYQTVAVACDSFFQLPAVCDTDMLSLVYQKKNFKPE